MSCECEMSFEYHDIVDCISSALDARDPYTGNHSRRVSDMACFLCGRLGISRNETQEIHIAGHLHDIGKIGVPDRVLLKPGRLDDGEWELMKKHLQIGAVRIKAFFKDTHCHSPSPRTLGRKRISIRSKGRGNTLRFKDHCSMRFH